VDEKALAAWLTLSSIPKVGIAKLNKLLALDAPQNLVKYSSEQFQAIGFSAAQIRHVQQGNKAVDECLKWLQHDEHSIITTMDDCYPPLLKQTKGHPPSLFVKGDVHTLSLPQIAMVGSRNASAEGMEAAQYFAGEFAKQNFVVTSGLAIGIDGHAHTGALRSGGQTVAVLGSGLNHIYPARHRELAKRIERQGVLVSEFWPDTSPRPEFFPRRNRIISGLSAGVLVVEATQKSGSLITTQYAAEQGREVFAIPGSIRFANHSGCHSLIRNGACLVEHPNEVINEIDSLVNWSKDNQPTLFDQVIETEELPYPELLANVGIEATSVDILAQKTHIPVHEAMTQLLELELSGYVVAVTGGYILKGRG
jgi:DNA processing protein